MSRLFSFPTRRALGSPAAARQALCRMAAAAVASGCLIMAACVKSSPSAPASEASRQATDAVCPSGQARAVSVQVEALKPLKSPLPREIFGFNVPRREFRDGYFRNHVIRKEIVDWLRPFEGALYRYPAGTPANWFEWRKAVGPMSQRTPVLDNYHYIQPVEFGYPEFLDFVSTVKGRALLTLNIAGPHGHLYDDQTAAREVLEFMQWMNSPAGAGCVSGDQCPVAFWEFGNELDWEGFKWPAAFLARRVNRTVETVSPVFPKVRWMVSGKSAPWDPRSSNAAAYDNELSALTDKRVEGVAVHPYYDGNLVPDVLKDVDRLANTWARLRPQTWIAVTEHARWPGTPPSGRWEDNWAEAINLDGALSTADFQLAAIAHPRIVATNLHTMSTEGPWQLFRWDQSTDTVYPSPVYWALRTLREGMLDRVVQITPALVPGHGYPGGYDMRLVSTLSPGAASVMGVNRSDQNIALTIQWRDFVPRTTEAQMHWITGLRDDNNTSKARDRITMQNRLQALPVGREQSTWCIPARAVFSVVER